VRRTLLLLPLVLGAAACGGGSSPYAERADAVCRDRVKEVATIATPRTSAEQTAAYELRLAAERREAARLRTIRPPHGHEQEAAALAGAVERVVDAAERLRVAELTADSESAQGALFEGRRAAADVRRYARALGLEFCGK
jgi:hypothetical protein